MTNTISEEILKLEPEVKKVRKATRTPKVPKERYNVGEFLKRGTEKFKILEIAESFYKVFSLDTNEELTIAKTGLKKFKPGQKDLKALESFEQRQNFTQPREELELLPLVEFPNAENLKALAAATEIGFDIETFGTLKQDDAFYPEKGEIRLLQVYLPSIDKCIVWDSGDLKNNKPLLELPGIDILKKRLSSQKCKVYIHSADFESKWIANKLRIPINNVVDSMILSQIYWAGLARGFNSCGISKPNSLEQVALRVLNVKPDKSNQTYDYALPLGNSQYNYAALDAKLTYQCGVKLLEMCYAEGLQRVVDADLSAIPAFAMMNYRGIPVDKQMLLELRESYQKAADEVIKPWMDLFPGTNPGSWTQVAKNLKEKWGIEPMGVDKKTGEPKICTDNPTLTPYALQHKEIDQLLFYRSLTKDVEYIDGYLEHVINVNGFDVIRPNYSQNAENCTGRTSSKRP